MARIANDRTAEMVPLLIVAAFVLTLVFSGYLMTLLPIPLVFLPVVILSLLIVVWLQKNPSFQIHKKRMPSLLLEFYAKKTPIPEGDINSHQIVNVTSIFGLKTEKTAHGLLVPAVDDIKKFEKIKIPVAIACFLLVAAILRPFEPERAGLPENMRTTGIVILSFVWITVGIFLSLGTYATAANYITKHKKLGEYRKNCLDFYEPTLAGFDTQEYNYMLKLLGFGEMLAVEFKNFKGIVFSYFKGVLWSGGRYDLLKHFGFQINIVAPQKNKGIKGAVWFDSAKMEKKEQEILGQIIKTKKIVPSRVVYETPVTQVKVYDFDQVYEGPTDYEWNTNIEGMDGLCRWLEEKCKSMGFRFDISMPGASMFGSIQFKGEVVYVCITPSLNNMGPPTKFAMELIEKLRADGLIG